VLEGVKGFKGGMGDMQTESHDFPAWPVCADDLRHWLKQTTGIRLADRPMIAGHASPWAYIEHSFYEGGALLDADAQQSLEDTPVVDTVVDAVVWANRGGGKTFLGAIATLLDMVFKPGIEIRILGGSLEQSKRMHTHLRTLLARPDLEWMVEGRITEKRIALANGSSVEVLAGSHTSVRGTRVQKLRCDEVELFDPDLWEAAQLTTRSATLHPIGRSPILVRGSVEALSTMHRPYGLMQRLVDEANAGSRRLFRWGVADVLEHCEPRRLCHSDAGDCALWVECAGRAKRPEQQGHISIEDAIRLKGRVSLAAWESEMLSLRPRRSDSVLPEFDHRVHVVQRVPDALHASPWHCGMDFGFRSPTVVLWAQLDQQGALWVQAERVESELVLDEHIRAIQAGPPGIGPPGIAPAATSHPEPVWIGVDPAGRQRNDQTGVSAIQAMVRSGLRVRHRSMAISDGLNLLRARLRPATGSGPRLFVHQRCQRLIESLERYRYPDQVESLKPIKDGHDHAVDALRYLVQVLDVGFETKSANYNQP